MNRIRLRVDFEILWFQKENRHHLSKIYEETDDNNFKNNFKNDSKNENGKNSTFKFEHKGVPIILPTVHWKNYSFDYF